MVKTLGWTNRPRDKQASDVSNAFMSDLFLQYFFLVKLHFVTSPFQLFSLKKLIYSFLKKEEETIICLTQHQQKYGNCSLNPILKSFADSSCAVKFNNSPLLPLSIIQSSEHDPNWLGCRGRCTVSESGYQAGRRYVFFFLVQLLKNKTVQVKM